LSQFADGPDRLRIEDTRSCAVRRAFSLEGLAAWVYTLCDQAVGAREIEQALKVQYGFGGGLDPVQATLDRLVGEKVLLAQNGRYLSLATREPCRPLLTNPADFPGGHVDIVNYRVLRALSARARTTRAAATNARQGGGPATAEKGQTDSAGNLFCDKSS
jgi:hypothetical protein